MTTLQALERDVMTRVNAYRRTKPTISEEQAFAEIVAVDDAFAASVARIAATATAAEVQAFRDAQRPAKPKAAAASTTPTRGPALLLRQFTEPVDATAALAANRRFKEEPMQIVSTQPQPRTKQQIWSEIQAMAEERRKAQRYTVTKETAMVELLNERDHHHLFTEYEAAPYAPPAYIPPPTPPTVDQATRQFSDAERKGETTPEDVDAVIRAKATELRKTRPDLTDAGAYVETMQAHPDLYQKYTDLHAARARRRRYPGNRAMLTG